MFKSVFMVDDCKLSELKFNENKGKYQVSVLVFGDKPLVCILPDGSHSSFLALQDQLGVATISEVSEIEKRSYDINGQKVNGNIKVSKNLCLVRFNPDTGSVSEKK